MYSETSGRWVGLVLSGVMLATLPACGGGAPVTSAGSAPASAARKAALLMRSSQAALARGDGAGAVRDAEAAVLLLPDQAEPRALLGRAYLAAGRFQSADVALADALTLDPAQGRVAASRALAQIALGRNDAALALLDQARGQAAEADIGLALALAGQGKTAISRLEAAARVPGADARTRQNLALAYALDGRWDDAAATAAIDLPIERVAERMRRWSQLSQRRDQPIVQVAMLLGTIPVADAGQPEMLALAPQPNAVPMELALAASALEPAKAIHEPMRPDRPTALIGEEADAGHAADVAASTTAAMTADAAMPDDAHATASPLLRIRVGAFAVAEMAPLPLPAVLPPMERTPPKVRPIPVAATSVKPKPMDPPAGPMMLVVQRTGPRPGREGRFVVQIGAYSSVRRTEAAWAQLNSRARFLSGLTPVNAPLRQGRATLYRLSISGLDSHAAASRLCARIKAAGGECFVRAASGDRPMRWATRQAVDPA